MQAASPQVKVKEVKAKEVKAKEVKVRAAKKHKDATTNAAVLDEACVAPDPLAVQSRVHRLTQSQCGARRCTCTRV